MLTIKGIQVSYGGSLILQGVDLSIQNGEIKALMGKNGMGKTTLLKTIMGLLAPRSGEILLEGKALQGLRTHEIAASGIGYVPQGREIFNDFTVWENLRLGLLGNPRKKRIIFDEIFEYFPILAERQQQRAGSFSGGEQQMLAIARALVSHPKLLLLDEPSEGIQPSIVDQICDILRKINKQTGLTILIVEQNVDMLLNLADSCAFMEKGQILESCSIQDVQADSTIIARHMTI
jgi:urea ABC transporter ATP-binding protein UrtE